MQHNTRLKNVLAIDVVIGAIVGGIVVILGCTAWEMLMIQMATLMLAIALEYEITLRIMKKVDHMVWLNDEGVGPLIGIVKGFMAFVGITCLIAIFVAIQETGTFHEVSYINLYIPSLVWMQMATTKLYAGEKYICIRGQYIARESIRGYTLKRTMKRGKEKVTAIIIQTTKGKPYVLYCSTMSRRVYERIVRVLDESVTEMGQPNTES